MSKRDIALEKSWQIMLLTLSTFYGGTWEVRSHSPKVREKRGVGIFGKLCSTCCHNQNLTREKRETSRYETYICSICSRWKRWKSERLQSVISLLVKLGPKVKIVLTKGTSRTSISTSGYFTEQNLVKCRN